MYEENHSYYTNGHNIEIYGDPNKRAGKRALPSFSEIETKTDDVERGKSMDSLPTQSKTNIHGSKDSHLGGGRKDSKTGDSESRIDDELDEDGHHHHTPDKFGTFDGVLGRCLLCMWGVIMFLRTGWIVGNAGIWQTTLVMVLSASITMFTTLSLSAICTNGEISHGGPYFLISRSLGMLIEYNFYTNLMI